MTLITFNYFTCVNLWSPNRAIDLCKLVSPYMIIFGYLWSFYTAIGYGEIRLTYMNIDICIWQVFTWVDCSISITVTFTNCVTRGLFVLLTLYLMQLSNKWVVNLDLKSGLTFHVLQRECLYQVMKMKFVLQPFGFSIRSSVWFCQAFMDVPSVWTFRGC